jgi:bifunctional non-homologous end joining protein LigD
VAGGSPLSNSRRPLCFGKDKEVLERRKPYAERKSALRKLLRHGRGIQYVENAEATAKNYLPPPAISGWAGIVSKKLDAPYRSGSSKTWIKIKNPKAPAATRATDGTF